MKLLNPWEIEIQDQSKYDLTINLIDQSTGETRQLRLDVNKLNRLYELLQFVKTRKEINTGIRCSVCQRQFDYPTWEKATCDDCKEQN